MPDSKESRERKVTGKRNQRLDREVEEELQQKEAAQERREEHESEEAERELAEGQ